jgi:hypothetical protein
MPDIRILAQRGTRVLNAHRARIRQQLVLAIRHVDEAREPIDRERARVQILHQYGQITHLSAVLTQSEQSQSMHKEDRVRLKPSWAQQGA